MSYRTCRRCSVTRVNTLCGLYDKAFHEGDDKAKRDLAHLARLAVERGYGPGTGVLAPGLSESDVRTLCWNISSLLEDEDLVRLGLDGCRTT